MSNHILVWVLRRSIENHSINHLIMVFTLCILHHLTCFMKLMVDDFHNIHSFHTPSRLVRTNVVHMASCIADVHPTVSAVPRPSSSLHRQVVINVNGQQKTYLGGIEVLHGSHVAWQEQKIPFPMGKEVLSNAKYFHCSCHATWLPCKTSIHVLSVLETLTHALTNMNMKPSFWTSYHKTCETLIQGNYKHDYEN